MVAGRAQELDDALAQRLQRIRGRLRTFAALDGASVGAALGAGAVAALVVLARWRGSTLGATMVAALIAAAAMVGAILRAARPISLTACARRADRMLDAQDRVLSALWLAGSAEPLGRAAVADALARTAHLAPSAAAPARRPVGLGALAASALALALAWLVPGGTRAARLPPARAPIASTAPVPAAALESERAAIAAAREQAERSGDRALGELTAALDQIVRGLRQGTLQEASALEALRALEQRASEAAAQASRDAQAAGAAEKALAASAATRDAAEALRGRAGGDQTAAALGDSAAKQPAATGAALRAAATALSDAASSADADQPGRRRLRQDDASGAQGAGAGASGRDEESRKLERLSRDLDEAATSCAQGDPSCSARARSGGRELSQVQRRGESGQSMRDVQRATRQLHDRIARGDLRGDSGAARAFARAAAGGAEPGQPNDRPGSPSSSSEPSGSQPGGDGAEQAAVTASAAGTADDGDGTASATAAGGGQSESASAGGGIGHENGGGPLGGRDTATIPPGRDARVPTADSGGPNRAQIIDGAAGRGFATRPYARVYTEYRAAVEDALGTASVPAGQQYLVRRYFDLIRPRPPATKGAPR